MSKKPATKSNKVKAVKTYTRAQAERALSAGADPNNFVKHANYHVRAKAWKKLGQPEMGNAEEHAKFLAGIHFKTPDA
jgi:hypothetical protein